MANSNRPSHSTGNASDFYLACRQGDLHKVNRYLKTMTIEDINKVEIANNSTALHAASYFGHTEIVKRLLELGANVHTRNSYGFTAEQEAQTQEIRDLFKHYK